MSDWRAFIHRPESQPGPPVGLERLIPPSCHASVRSLGWELHRLNQAVRLLSARVRNHALSPALLEFLSRVPPPQPAGARAEISVPFTVRTVDDRAFVCVSWEALGPKEDSALLLALLHLPALRAFWERALRRSHFHRLRREMPRAWFLENEPPPPGAIVPGLGIVFKSNIPAEARRHLASMPSSGNELPVLIEDATPADAARFVATYARNGDRVTLASISKDHRAA